MAVNKIGRNKSCMQLDHDIVFNPLIMNTLYKKPKPKSRKKTKKCEKSYADPFQNFNLYDI